MTSPKDKLPPTDWAPYFAKANVLTDVLVETATQTTFSDPKCTTPSGQPIVQHLEGVFDEAAGTVETFTRQVGGGAQLEAVWAISAPMGRCSYGPMARAACPTPRCRGSTRAWTS